MNRHNHKHSNPKTVVGTRTCFVCKTPAPRAEMLRFVGRAGQTVCFDAKEVMPGRGMWLHANKACLEQAIDKKLFYKAAKGTVHIPTDLMCVVEQMLEKYPEKQKLFLEGASHE